MKGNNPTKAKRAYMARYDALQHKLKEIESLAQTDPATARALLLSALVEYLDDWNVSRTLEYIQACEAEKMRKDTLALDAALV